MVGTASQSRRSGRKHTALVAAASLILLSSCIHKKYDNPIAKNTQQPDKVLFDQAVKDIEHGRYEIARISLQTLMNTYESSEYLAKAKLAIADSWYREAGANGLAQAEAEYKDFILFYPNMEESAEAQNRVCEIHYRQMDRSDRDWTQTLRAEAECRSLLQQFPNSKFAPVATQRLRNIQESLADHEFVVGTFYWRRDMNPAAANRLTGLVDQYPLYSEAGESLYEAGDAYSKMGPRFRKQAGEQFAKLVRDYPGSPRVKEATRRLQEMEMPVPQPSQAAMDRARYEASNYRRPGMMTRSTSFLRGTPDVSHAAHAGAPTMTEPKRGIPASVPVPAVASADNGTSDIAGGTTDVTATTVGTSTALETKPDARTAAAGNDNAGTAPASTGTASGSSNGSPAVNEPLPTNRDADLKKLRERQAKQQAKQQKKTHKSKDEKTTDSASDSSAKAQGSGQPANQPATPPSSPQQ